MHSYKGYHLHYFKVKEQRIKERDGGGERERETDKAVTLIRNLGRGYYGSRDGSE